MFRRSDTCNDAGRREISQRRVLHVPLNLPGVSFFVHSRALAAELPPLHCFCREPCCDLQRRGAVQSPAKDRGCKVKLSHKVQLHLRRTAISRNQYAEKSGTKAWRNIRGCEGAMLLADGSKAELTFPLSGSSHPVRL